MQRELRALSRTPLPTVLCACTPDFHFVPPPMYCALSLTTVKYGFDWYYDDRQRWTCCIVLYRYFLILNSLHCSKFFFIAIFLIINSANWCVLVNITPVSVKNCISHVVDFNQSITLIGLYTLWWIRCLFRLRYGGQRVHVYWSMTIRALETGLPWPNFCFFGLRLFMIIDHIC